MRKEERTSNPKEHLCLPQPAIGLIPIVQHLQHRTHLPPTILRLVLHDRQLVPLGAPIVALTRRCPIDLDNTVSRVCGVGGDDVEADTILVEEELVVDRLGVWMGRRVWARVWVGSIGSDGGTGGFSGWVCLLGGRRS